MGQTPLRSVAMWQAEIDYELRDDGAYIIRQKAPLPEYPPRLSDKLLHYAKHTPDQLWMAERGEDDQWVKLTYGDMLPQVQSIAQALLDLDLGVERPLVILSQNSIAHGVVALAAQYVGIASAALAPAYSLQSQSFEKLRQIADQITPGAVFADDLDQFKPALEGVFNTIPWLGVKGDGGVRDWQTLLATPVSDAVHVAREATGPDTIAKFMLTSGTTGSPKAVVQTQRMLCSNMAMVQDCYAWMKDEPPVVVDWAPWNHVASGNKVFNMVIYCGGSYYLDHGKPVPGLVEKTINNLREVSPTWYFNVPAGYEMLVEAMRKDSALAESFFKKLKLMMYAGAAMAEHTWQALDQLALQTTGSRILLATGLGSTETAPFALFCTEPQDKPGNVGIPSKGLELKLVPMDGKWDTRLRGPSITPGYWREDTLSRRAFDEEGFYCMGDALRFAEPGHPEAGFFFDGRTAENFKMATGTWVAVGALRAKLIDALQGCARDAVIAGEGRNELGALLLPFRPALERLLPDADEARNLDDDALLSHASVRLHIARLLATYNAQAGGASLRITRVLWLTQPLSLDKGEITDKGSVNQRAVLRHHQATVESLFTEDPAVIRPG